jgi:hypothetical protein
LRVGRPWHEKPETSPPLSALHLVHEFKANHRDAQTRRELLELRSSQSGGLLSSGNRIVPCFDKIAVSAGLSQLFAYGLRAAGHHSITGLV